MSQNKIGVVLVNLGTPDEPTPSAVRRYLKEFLSDSRVIEVPRPVWWMVLRCFILPFRPARVARLYASVWTGRGSPMRAILEDQTAAVQARLAEMHPERAWHVRAAMTYGQPSVAAVLSGLQAEGVSRVLVLPLYPQYSATTTGAVYDAVSRWVQGSRDLPELRLVRNYHEEPAYIQALAASVRDHWQHHARPQKLLMSFHGIPRKYEDKGDPYPAECRRTAAAVAQELGLSDGEWAISFQSRFGPDEWVQPYTDQTLEAWGRAGIHSVHVMCPAFAADCLETLEEIAVENCETFLHAGGKEYSYIPALNVREDHLGLLAGLVCRQSEGW